jgi:hypothetical protein
VLHLLRIHDAHEKPLRHSAEIFFVRKPKNDLARSVFHNGVIHPFPVLSAIKQLIRKLVRHCEVKPEAARFVEIFRNRR